MRHPFRLYQRSSCSDIILLSDDCSVPVLRSNQRRSGSRCQGGAERATEEQQSHMIAFALQGGGSLSAAEDGMLRGLTEHGIVPDLVVGASAGALNAVAFAANPTAAGIDQLDAIWRSMRRRHVAPLSAWGPLAAVAGRSGGLVSNAPLRHFIQTRLPVGALAETAIPAYVVATDLESGEPVVLSGGDAVSALLASSAFPRLYPPVTIGGGALLQRGGAAGRA